MEGPRALRAHELGSLSKLADTVFQSKNDGQMVYQFPVLFGSENHENLLVFVDGGKVVSHVGMVQRWASLAGCTVKVGLIGSVATYEDYRGKGLASQLFAAAAEKAVRDGCDFFMISGGRGLYRRAGAADAARPPAPDATSTPAVPARGRGRRRRRHAVHRRRSGRKRSGVLGH